MTSKPIEARSVEEHREAGAGSLQVAVLTVSDTRTDQTDTGGALIRELLEERGHKVSASGIVADEPGRIRDVVTSWTGDGAIDAIIITGGTGLAPRDRTVEALEPLLDRIVEGFGELFRMLSFEEVGPAAMLSRAMAGVSGKTPVFALPGSRNAIRLAMERLILPELGHVVYEVRKEPPTATGTR